MRANRQSGSEGGAGSSPRSYPYRTCRCFIFVFSVFSVVEKEFTAIALGATRAAVAGVG